MLVKKIALSLHYLRETLKIPENFLAQLKKPICISTLVVPILQELAEKKITGTVIANSVNIKHNFKSKNASSIVKFPHHTMQAIWCKNTGTVQPCLITVLWEAVQVFFFTGNDVTTHISCKFWRKILSTIEYIIYFVFSVKIFCI